MTRLLVLFACLTSLIATATAAPPAVGPWGLSLDYIDRSVGPGADFFKQANGGWLKNAAIPGDRQIAGVNLELNKSNEQHLRDSVEQLVAAPEGSLNPEQRKLRDLYSAFMDTAVLEIRGLAPAQPDLDRIAGLHTLAQVASFLGDPATPAGGPFALSLEVDEKNPDAYTVALSQWGLGMPDRDYYLLKDKDSAATRAAYRRYIARMLAVAGVPDAKRAAAVYALEMRLARMHWPAAERRQADKVYNRMGLTELERYAPRFPWRVFLTAAGVPLQGPGGERHVTVREKSAFPHLARVFATTPLPVWRDYLRVHYLHYRAASLPPRIDEVDFDFYGRVIGGQSKQLPRELRAVNLLDTWMGEALGKLYVERHFSPQAKAQAQALVTQLLRAYAEDIRTLDWMTEATRARALEKVRTLRVKVGYPDTWRDYSGLQIEPGKLFEDVARAQRFEWQRQLKRLDGTVDRGEWDMTPPTNNAYYNPTLNEIVFPAGILQPPYFDPNADDAVNYGSIGATIGHEISHAFDDQGSKYDATGRLNNWWTDSDRKAFDARTRSLAQQYDRYEPLPGLHLNGSLTLGENIADLAGLVIAHKAYRLSLGDKPAPVLDGYTGDQRFYLAYAQSWREIWTDGLMHRIVLSNPHSPSAYRVNGVVRNDDGWYEAFGDISPADPYYLLPNQRVRLW